MIKLRTNIMRSDCAGAGYYNAKRGRRKHKGIDLLCLPGCPIYADTDLEFVRIARPHTYGSMSGGLWRDNKGNEVKLFYCVPVTSISRFHKGDTIAYSQNVQHGYNDNKIIMPHIHCEIKVKGKRINPIKMIKIDG